VINRNLEVVFIPTPRKDPVTGGEIYNMKLLKFLQKKFRNTESIEIGIFRTEAKKYYEILFFGLTSIIRNFLYMYAIFSENKFLLTLFRTIETIFLSESDWIIANSEATAKSIRQLTEKAKKFLVAYPGLDNKKMMCRKTGNLCNDSESSGRRLNLLAVGSLTERKDFRTLLRAIRMLVDRYGEKKFFVNVIGDLEKDKCYSTEILESAKVLSLSNHVAFRGRMDANRLFDFYTRSDIFVSTSLHEGFGMAVAEAMYHHLPVVATNCGAIPYLVQDGVNGFLVPPGDYGKLAERIVRLLESGELRKNMGDKGFHKAKEFNWNRTFNKIYRKLLETSCAHTVAQAS
jgi:glycosyltransferase involved in cell wall biosynthesis